MVGRAAAALIEPGTTVGLGSGSTAKQAVFELARRCRSGELTDINCVPTSESTAALASSLGIPLAEQGDTPIDIAIDGADEIGPDLSLIKGAGGALLREKIVAAAARVFVVIGDSSKLVRELGVGSPVPVEVATFGYKWTLASLREFGDAVVRVSGDGPFTTDNGNFIVDLRLGGVPDPAGLDTALMAVPGVLVTGLFNEMTTMALVAEGSTLRELRPGDPSG